MPTQKSIVAEPNPDIEAPEDVDATLQQEVSRLLNERHLQNLLKHERISIKVRTGDNASWLEAQVGDHKKAHVFEFFVRDKNLDLEARLALLFDYADGVLAEFFESERNAFFPLDFVSREFENQMIFARHEFRNFDAEALADALLKKS